MDVESSWSKGGSGVETLDTIFLRSISSSVDTDVRPSGVPFDSGPYATVSDLSVPDTLTGLSLTDLMAHIYRGSGTSRLGFERVTYVPWSLHYLLLICPESVIPSPF